MAFTGNASYSGLAAVAIEQSVRQAWSMVWTSSHPLTTVIQHKNLNFNRGFSIMGLAMLLAVMGDDQTNPVAGVASGSAELTPMTANLTNALSQFKFNYGHYRGNYVLLESEAKLAMNGARGNILEGKKSQMLGSLMNTYSTHLSSTTADQADNSRLLGLYQPLSTSNTVGGISQSTDTQIAATVKSSAGPFALELIEDVQDALTNKSNPMRNNGAKPDVALASFAPTNNVFGKYRSAIAPALRYVNPDYKVKYGLENFEHNGMMVLQEGRIGTTLNGSVAVLSSGTWFASVETQPEFHPRQRISLTDAYEHVITAWAALGCNDPGLNGLVRDLT